MEEKDQDNELVHESLTEDTTEENHIAEGIKVCFRCKACGHYYEKRPKICDNLSCRKKEFYKLPRYDTPGEAYKSSDPMTCDLTACKSKREVSWRISTFMLTGYRFLTFNDNEECFYYDFKEGIYKPAEAFIKKYVVDFLDKDATIHTIREIINKIKIRSFIDRDSIKHNPNLICVNNGVFNLGTNKFTAHSHEYKFFSKLPVNYDPEAECPRIKQFLSEIVHTEDIITIDEMIGYCLYPDYILHKAFMLVGSGRNGKGTLLRLLNRFLGEENCVGIPLQKLTANKFAPAMLYKKLANLCGDNSSRKVVATDTFKWLTGEDRMFAEFKGIKGFFFTNYAKLIFSTNTVPITTDDTYAFWSRWIYFKFENVFEAGKNADPFLLKKLTTEQELSGLLNLALLSLNRLIYKQKFSYNRSTKNVSEEWIRASDSVGAFVIDAIEYDNESEFRKKTLYEEQYLMYCSDMEYPKDSIMRYEDFCAKLKLHCKGKIKSSYPRKGDKRHTIWVGIKVKDEWYKGDKNSDEAEKEKEQQLLHT